MTSISVPSRDLAWCSPDELPEVVRSFDRRVGGSLPVGAPGKVGVLDLSLKVSGGRTKIDRQYQRAPLYIYRPVYLDPARPDMAFIFMQQSGDGFVQGDRARIDLSCGRGTAAHVTTQATTKIFAAPENHASQLVNLRAESGTVLEYLPDPNTPFKGSRFFQRTTVTADRESTVFLAETLLPGRVARGEKHAYDLYWSETEFRDATGRLLFSDVLRLCPAGGADPRSMALLGGYDVVASFYVLSRQASGAKLAELLRGSLAECPEVLVGVSELPNSAGVGVRLLGPTSLTIQAALRTAWTVSRLELLGVSPPNLRKG